MTDAPKPPADSVADVIDAEEKYLIGHFDADCGIMPGDIEGSFHRIRAAMSAPVGEPTAYLSRHPSFGRDLQFTPLAEVDREQGWVDTPLYIRPAPSVGAEEIARIVDPTPFARAWKPLSGNLRRASALEKARAILALLSGEKK